MTSSSTVTPPFLGVCLDPFGVQIAESDGTLQILDLPPSALLPMHPGEPVRADIAVPAHVRGAGLRWPLESRFDDTGGCGRFPIAHAWHMLNTGDAPLLWQWQRPDGTPSELDAPSAIAAVLAGVVARGKQTGADAPERIVLTIPDMMSESAQQQLIDAAGAQGFSLHLLWRPVAAAIDWCTRHASRLLEEHADRLDARTAPDAQIVLGQLLVLYLGVEALEATFVSLVACRDNDVWVLLPGRHRPVAKNTVTPGLWPVAETAIVKLSGSTERAWSLGWAQRAQPAMVELLSTPAQDEHHRQTQRTWSDAYGSERALLTRLSSRFLKQAASTAAIIQAWGNGLREISPDAPVLGVVCVGAFASVLTPSGRLAEDCARTAGCAGVNIEIEGLNGIRAGGVAAGAAEYAARLATERPTYLDTLPQVRLLVGFPNNPDREYGWKPLLADTDRWVMGGRQWRREPDVTGLHVKAGDKQSTSGFTLTVHHEEHETVRFIDTELDLSLPKPVPIHLAVWITPAQGRARIQVVPEEEGALGRKPVYVDWQRMHKTDFTPEEYIQQLPRTFPPLMPRHSSNDRWHTCRWRIKDVLSQVQRGRLDFVSLKALGTELNQGDTMFNRDPVTGSRYATAIASDGRTPGAIPCPELDELVDRLCARLPKPTQSPDSDDEQVIRVLGYLSTPAAEYQRYLRETVRIRGTTLDRATVEAVGWALTDSKGCGEFAEVLGRICRSETPKLYWIKAMAHLLRYRRDAPKHITSKLAVQICDAFCKVFQAQRLNNNGAQLFKWSALAIVFLLRRRAWDADFLPPTSPLASRLKEEFASAFFALPPSKHSKEMRDQFPRIAKHVRRASLSMQGGSIDVQSALVQLIRYIDRQGQGFIQLSGDE